ncbi:MAG: uL13 family ribosomal protein, partial [Bacteroidales bacterium]|nr:uL13 family ribosomal protein [Bacteroidales bacterium]
RITTPEEMFRKDPARLIEHAVRGMLPKNRLGRQIFTNLHVYAGPEHPHEAQKPKEVNVKLK